MLLLLLTLTSAMKTSIRANMRCKLKELSAEHVNIESNKVYERLLRIPEYLNSRGLSVFISMNGEVQTSNIIDNAFSSGKRVIVPKILGKTSESMFMLEVRDKEQLESFPKNSWGIAEPPIELVKQSEDCTYNGSIDLIVVPGVIFDTRCGRVGHGKGYYGMVSKAICRL